MQIREDAEEETAEALNEAVDADRAAFIAGEEIYKVDSVETLADMDIKGDSVYIEPDYRIAVDLSSEGVADVDNSANYDMINIAPVWDREKYATGVQVAVIDTGVVGLQGGSVYHEDLDYFRVSAGKTVARGYDDADYANDDRGHGTAVAGEIAAVRGNEKGVSGMAPEASIISVKMLDQDGACYISDFLSALTASYEAGAEVINVSLSWFASESEGAYSSVTQDLINTLADEGVIIVAAAGNRGLNEVSYPAAYDNVIGVTALTKTGAFAGYNCYESGKVDCAAPGAFTCVGIESETSYASRTGTSMAAPVVSSLAAILKQRNDEITTRGFMNVLSLSCQDAGDIGYDEKYGYGIVDFDSALDALDVLTITDSLNEELDTPQEEQVDIRTKKSSASLSYTSKTYTGKALKPAVTIRGLTKGTDYTVTYKNNKAVGKASVIIKGKGDYNGSFTKTFRIRPKNTSTKELKALKKGFKLTWKKKFGVTGYQVRYGTAKSMKNAKIRTVTSAKTTEKTVKSLTKNRKYYVQIRTYKTISNTKYVSLWSAARVVKTK